jgi:hypothetical protein
LLETAVVTRFYRNLGLLQFRGPILRELFGLATWEELSIDLILPSNTDFVAIRVDAFEDVFNDLTTGEFDGHFADAVSLVTYVVPEPATGLLLACGLAMLSVRRRGWAV